MDTYATVPDSAAPVDMTMSGLFVAADALHQVTWTSRRGALRSLDLQFALLYHTIAIRKELSQDTVALAREAAEMLGNRLDKFEEKYGASGTNILEVLRQELSDISEELGLTLA